MLDSIFIYKYIEKRIINYIFKDYDKLYIRYIGLYRMKYTYRIKRCF